MRFEGTLTFWDDERGFGRIESTQGGEPIFVHVSARPCGRRERAGPPRDAAASGERRTPESTLHVLALGVFAAVAVPARPWLLTAP
jgi:hypothetical protein